MADPCAPPITALPPVKGDAVLVFRGQQLAALSDTAIDCSDFNAVSVQVILTGSSASATVSVEGAGEQGGNYLPLPDLNASQTAVTASKNFDVIVGSRFAKIRLASVSGTFGSGQGYTIIVTPFVSPGSARIAASIVVDTLAAIQVLTGALTVSDVLSIGALGGIYQGSSGSFASPGTGFKLYNINSNGRIEFWNGGTLSLMIDYAGILLNPQTTGIINFGTDPATTKASIQYDLTHTEMRLLNDAGASAVLNLYFPAVAIGAAAGFDVTMAQSGLIRMTNNGWIAARNFLGTADVNMIRVNTTNQVTIGGPLRVDGEASTGANTPTLGTNKPGSAATLTPQKWLKVNLDGTDHYVPCWI